MASPVFDNSYSRLPDCFYARMNPAQVPAPALIKTNKALAERLGIDPVYLASPEAIGLFSGNEIPEGAEPLAMAYAGHQFGGWSPQLGDGRALLIGEIIDKNGLRLDIQLKGSGRTPFSRGGDGKAGIGPVVREYILSEAMHALGVPTTRALAAVTSGETIHRSGPIPGAIFTRVAQSHVRVGTFQYFAARDAEYGQGDTLRQLADYVIDRHYPEARHEDAPYKALLQAVVKRQARLIAQWMQLGFIHGVMNTDNMQIVGETIDYGPCAFIDEYHPNKVFSSIDRDGRYSWNNQPEMGQWNLARLAEALLPLLDANQETAIAIAQDVVTSYFPLFFERFMEIFADKTGLLPEDANDEFMQNTFKVMADQKVDFTLFFRHLTKVARQNNTDERAAFFSLFDDEEAGKVWLAQWEALFAKTGNSPTESQAERALKMARVNPIFIPRNHRVEAAIQAGLEGDFTVMEDLLKVLEKPYDEEPEFADYEHPPKPEEIVKRTFCGT